MNKTKAVLVIDTAMEGCGVAVYNARRDVICDAYNDDARGQAQRLVPMVQDVLAKADVAFDDISDIVVCNGPGTFTGIRIGLSAAKTFGLTLGARVHAITSLQALALSACAKGAGKDMLVLVETRRQDFYVQSFDGNGVATDGHRSEMANDIDVGERILIGNAVERFDKEEKYFRGDVSKIDVGCVARAFLDGVNIFENAVLPIYLRAPDVSQPKTAPRQLVK